MWLPVLNDQSGRHRLMGYQRITAALQHHMTIYRDRHLLILSYNPKNTVTRCLSHLIWLFSLQGSSGSTPMTGGRAFHTISNRGPNKSSSFRPLLPTIMFWSLPKAHGHR